MQGVGRMTMNQTEALALLRSNVSGFARSERLALTTLLTVQCNPRFRKVTYEADPPFHGWLDAALAVTNNFNQQQKLTFASELLQEQLSGDEVTGYSGSPNPNNYEGEEDR
jgi:hypothetical protein